jgi:hypothetical protein
LIVVNFAGSEQRFFSIDTYPRIEGLLCPNVGQVMGDKIVTREFSGGEITPEVNKSGIGFQRLFTVVDTAGSFSAVFYFFLYVIHGVFEFTHTFSEALHEFRNLFGAKKHENKYSNEQDFLETNTTEEQ